MQLKKWIPNKENEALKDWEGYVEYRPLSFIERKQFQIEFGLHIDKDGKGELKTENFLIQFTQMFKLLEKVVQKVDLTHIPSQSKIASVEDLGMFQECEIIIIEVARSIMEGTKLSKN